jgi:chromosome segregation ATPase
VGGRIGRSASELPIETDSTDFMSSRTPGVPPAGIPSYRQDDDRRRAEANLTTLQSQVDEVRQALRELASRQVRLEENVKTFEGASTQNRIQIDQVRKEHVQSQQARSLDENRTRQQVADLEQMMQDATRPVRSMQAHIGELLETNRKKTDDAGQSVRRVDEMKSLIDNLQALGDRNAVVTHQLRDAVDALRSEVEQVRRDILRSEDAIKVVDQEARRRIAEVAQVTEGFGSRMDEIRSDLAHAFDMVEEVRRSVAHVDPTLEELREADAVTRVEVNRLQAQSVERHEMLVERIDDTRASADTHLLELRTSMDQRFERASERMERLTEEFRQLEFKVSSMALGLDELKQTDVGLRREIWALHEQRLRSRLEQVQQELEQVTGSRRTVEAEARTTPDPDAPKTIRSLDL